MSVKNIILVLIMTLLVIMKQGEWALASDRLPPMTKKNKNEVTDFFDKEIENRKGFQQKIEESKNIGIKQLENTEAINNLPDTSGISNKAEELKKLDQNRAEEGGYKVRAENKDYLDRAHLNYKDPQVLRHKQDIDKIANGTEELLSKLYDKLKELGVDCRQKKGLKETEPEMYIEIEPLPQKEVIYDKFLCEAPRRQYNCRDELTIGCADLQFVPGALTNVAGNMRYTLDHNGYMTIGVNKTAYFYNDWGAQNDFTFTFNVSNALGIESFKILQVDWADHVLIKLNDQILFQSPGVNGKVEMSYHPSHYRIATDGERYYGVDVGTGNYITANTKRYHNAHPHAEGKLHLKDGNNVLHIRLAYGRGGKIWLALQFRERKCNAWQETWNEKCTQM